MSFRWSCTNLIQEEHLLLSHSVGRCPSSAGLQHLYVAYIRGTFKLQVHHTKTRPVVSWKVSYQRSHITIAQPFKVLSAGLFCRGEQEASICKKETSEISPVFIHMLALLYLWGNRIYATVCIQRSWYLLNSNPNCKPKPSQICWHHENIL